MNKKGIELSINSFVMIMLGVVVIMLGLVFLMKIMDIFPEQKLEVSAPTILETSIFPEKGRAGTIFRIRTSAPSEISISSAIASINGEAIQLYDDGNHGDGNFGDGVFAGAWDSINSNIGKITGALSVDSSEGVLRNYFLLEVFGNSCREVFSNGNSADKIDIVVLGQDYDSLEEFNEKVWEYIDVNSQANGLFSFTPFTEQKSKFNVYIVNKSLSYEDLGCRIGCRGINSMVCCNDKKVSRVAAECHADHTIILLNNESFCGSASSYAKVCTGARNNPMVLVHEFGHTFGGLGDEYSYGAYANLQRITDYNFPNCVDDCAKWPVDVESECITGCGYSSYFRSTERDSIMYAYVPRFNPVSIYYLNQKLAGYSEEIGSQNSELLAPASEQPRKYLSELSLYKGRLMFGDVYAMTGLAADRIQIAGGYEARILSADNSLLYSTQFEILQINFPFYEQDSEYIPGAFFEENVNYTLILPYYNDAQKIELYNSSGNKLLEFNVGYLSKALVCSGEDCGVWKKESENENIGWLIILGILVLAIIVYYAIRFIRWKKVNRALDNKYYSPY